MKVGKNYGGLVKNDVFIQDEQERLVFFVLLCR